MFNGYADQVASMYAGMDLQEELLSHRTGDSAIVKSATVDDAAQAGGVCRSASCRRCYSPGISGASLTIDQKR